MLFNSLVFLVFFPVVVVCFFVLPYRFRWIFLLAASYYFYMVWRPEYAVLMAISTVVAYLSSLRMAVTRGRRKQIWLAVSLVVNLGILFTFKYFNFFSESFELLLQQFNIFYNSPTLKILLPVGISFYTFQTLSYSLDVYRGVRPPERHLGHLALYVSFFPQLVAGPIERSTTLLPQFKRPTLFDPARATTGLRLVLWGFFKKIVIADNAALIVSAVYGNPDNYGGLALMLGTFFFAVQIYADFSAYSDIAIGTARILGYDLSLNFNRPYLSRSVVEFWRRWHVSLMNWFRDYVYIPLGGGRVTPGRWVNNILTVFF